MEPLSRIKIGRQFEVDVYVPPPESNQQPYFEVWKVKGEPTEPKPKGFAAQLDQVRQTVAEVRKVLECE